MCSAPGTPQSAPALMAQLQFDQAQVAHHLVEAVMVESPLYHELVAERKAEGIREAEALLQMAALRFAARQGCASQPARS